MTTTVVDMVFLIAWLFIYCEAGERVMNEFNAFHEKLCQCRWYAFSVEVQQIYLTTSSCTQEPVVIHGFANTACTRDAFKRVIFLDISVFSRIQFGTKLITCEIVFFSQIVKGGFSYFTMLRRINSQLIHIVNIWPCAMKLMFNGWTF